MTDALHKVREAMEKYQKDLEDGCVNAYTTIARIQAILAEPEGEAPVAADQVAWMLKIHGKPRSLAFFKTTDSDWAPHEFEWVPLYAAAPQTPAKPAAWRYQDSRGHYRYRGYKPGFDKEYAILKPVPLYLHHAPQTPAQPEARRPVSDLWDHGDIQPIPNDKPRRNMVLVPADKLRELQQAAKAQPEALTAEQLSQRSDLAHRLRKAAIEESARPAANQHLVKLCKDAANELLKPLPPPERVYDHDGYRKGVLALQEEISQAVARMLTGKAAEIPPET